MKATLPDMTSRTFSFTVQPNLCISAVFTPSPLMTDQNYIVSDVYSAFTTPEFSSSIVSCSATYTNAISPSNGWMTDSGGSGRVVGWYTTDELDMGTYTVTITA